MRLGEVVMERGGDVGLLLVDHLDDPLELRRPPLRRARPPRREAGPQVPHRLRRHAPPSFLCLWFSPPLPLFPATETAELSGERGEEGPVVAVGATAAAEGRRFIYTHTSGRSPDSPLPAERIGLDRAAVWFESSERNISCGYGGDNQERERRRIFLIII